MSGEHRLPGEAGSRTAYAGHVIRQMAWGPLLAGCLAGLGLTWALLVLAGATQTPQELAVGVRVGFLLVVVGLAFLLQDQGRQLTGALPARAWKVPVTRIAIALPVAGLTGVIQLLVAGHALAADQAATRMPRAPLPWLALATELAAWSVLALALAAALERTRWRDLAGMAAAAGTMAVVGVVDLVPLHLLPGVMTGMTTAQHRHWMHAWLTWLAVAVLALVMAGWASGDQWHRISVHTPRLRRTRRTWDIPDYL